MVLLKIVLIMSLSICCECVFVQSSFWAPLFNPKILNYRVDAIYNPEAGKNNREAFENNYGYRGQELIAGLGNGEKPSSAKNMNNGDDFGEVRFYYTYPGAYQNTLV